MARIKSAPKTSKSAAKKAKAGAIGSKENSLMGYQLKTWISGARKAKGNEARSGRRGFLIAMASRDAKALKAALNGHLSKWQMEIALSADGDCLHYQGAQGPVWVLRGPKEQSQDRLAKSGFAFFRDLAGGVVSALQPYTLDKLVVETHGLGLNEERGIFAGLEMARYRFTENRLENESAAPTRTSTRKKLPQLLLKKTSEGFSASELKTCAHLACAVNMARHLTNLPGGDLTPETYAEAVRSLFAESETVKVDVWEGERLVAERMNLLLAVGRGAQHGPRFVHLSYRPQGVTTQPIAIVGKGVTFDSGGLDIKPSSSMRLMKKDMGGSAAAVAIAKWAEDTGLQCPLDVYLSIAENAVSGSSLRPGDIVTARNGLSIEIHNTDAEGRLVMADAFDVAVSAQGADKPSKLIDIATLTGAIKVGLGAEIAGLFANDDALAAAIEASGTEMGDLAWRMPLYQPYKNSLRSNFADHTNCSEGGFGGAITAALFLELFVKKMPWAHLDVYAWKDSSGGAWSEAGGSGQPVLLLSNLLAKFAQKD